MARRILESELEASLFPNPTTGAFTVALDREVDGNLQVFDLQGRLVGSRQLMGAQTVELDLGSQANGTFLVRIVVGDQIITKKISVIKP